MIQGPSGTRKIATLTGWLMVVTFITSIPAYFILYAPVRNNPDYIPEPAPTPPQAWLWVLSSSSSSLSRTSAPR
jgi:hypothetical protein